MNWYFNVLIEYRVDVISISNSIPFIVPNWKFSKTQRQQKTQCWFYEETIWRKIANKRQHHWSFVCQNEVFQLKLSIYFILWSIFVLTDNVVREIVDFGKENSDFKSTNINCDGNWIFTEWQLLSYSCLWGGYNHCFEVWLCFSGKWKLFGKWKVKSLSLSLMI